MEITIKIDGKSKQANAILEMLKTFDFVRFVDNEQEAPSSKKVKLPKDITKIDIKKPLSESGLNCSKEQFLDSISKKVNKGMAQKWYAKSGIPY